MSGRLGQGKGAWENGGEAWGSICAPEVPQRARSLDQLSTSEIQCWRHGVIRTCEEVHVIGEGRVRVAAAVQVERQHLKGWGREM